MKFFLYIIINIIISFILFSCNNYKPIKIGFSGTLTGVTSNTGIAVKNGVILAIDEVNKKGGIRGNKIKLIIKDDQNDKEISQKIDKELIDEGVVAIIGHTTSSMTIASLNLINQTKTLMIGTTVTAKEGIAGIDDYFLRVSPIGNETESLKQSIYAYNNNIKKISVIYDSTNKTYSLEWLNNFKTKYEELGGQIIFTKEFESNTSVSYINFVKELLEVKSDGILIIASTINTALLCQQIRKSNNSIPIFSSGWAMVDEVIQYGGASMEGVVFSHHFDKESKLKTYLNFKEKYIKKFNTEPSFDVVAGYDAATLLTQGLYNSKSLKSDKIKQSILNMDVFNGVMGNIHIDRFGDAEKEYFLFIVKDGKFTKIE